MSLGKLTVELRGDSSHLANALLNATAAVRAFYEQLKTLDDDLSTAIQAREVAKAVASLNKSTTGAKSRALATYATSVSKLAKAFSSYSSALSKLASSVGPETAESMVVLTEALSRFASVGPTAQEPLNAIAKAFNALARVKVTPELVAGIKELTTSLRSFSRLDSGKFSDVFASLTAGLTNIVTEVNNAVSSLSSFGGTLDEVSSSIDISKLSSLATVFQTISQAVSQEKGADVSFFAIATKDLAEALGVLSTSLTSIKEPATEATSPLQNLGTVLKNLSELPLTSDSKRSNPFDALAISLGKLASAAGGDSLVNLEILTHTADELGTALTSIKQGFNTASDAAVEILDPFASATEGIKKFMSAVLDKRGNTFDETRKEIGRLSRAIGTLARNLGRLSEAATISEEDMERHRKTLVKLKALVGVFQTSKRAVDRFYKDAGPMVQQERAAAQLGLEPGNVNKVIKDVTTLEVLLNKVQSVAGTTEVALLRPVSSWQKNVDSVRIYKDSLDALLNLLALTTPQDRATASLLRFGDAAAGAANRLSRTKTLVEDFRQSFLSFPKTAETAVVSVMGSEFDPTETVSALERVRDKLLDPFSNFRASADLAGKSGEEFRVTLSRIGEQAGEFNRDFGIVAARSERQLEKAGAQAEAYRRQVASLEVPTQKSLEKVVRSFDLFESKGTTAPFSVEQAFEKSFQRLQKNLGVERALEKVRRAFDLFESQGTTAPLKVEQVVERSFQRLQKNLGLIGGVIPQATRRVAENIDSVRKSSQAFKELGSSFPETQLAAFKEEISVFGPVLRGSFARSVDQARKFTDNSNRSIAAYAQALPFAQRKATSAFSVITEKSRELTRSIDDQAKAIRNFRTSISSERSQKPVQDIIKLTTQLSELGREGSLGSFSGIFVDRRAEESLKRIQARMRAIFSLKENLGSVLSGETDRTDKAISSLLSTPLMGAVDPLGKASFAQATTDLSSVFDNFDNILGSRPVQTARLFDENFKEVTKTVSKGFNETISLFDDSVTSFGRADARLLASFRRIGQNIQNAPGLFTEAGKKKFALFFGSDPKNLEENIVSSLRRIGKVTRENLRIEIDKIQDPKGDSQKLDANRRLVTSAKQRAQEIVQVYAQAAIEANKNLSILPQTAEDVEQKLIPAKDALTSALREGKISQEQYNQAINVGRALTNQVIEAETEALDLRLKKLSPANKEVVKSFLASADAASKQSTELSKNRSRVESYITSLKNKGGAFEKVGQVADKYFKLIAGGGKGISAYLASNESLTDQVVRVARTWDRLNVTQKTGIDLQTALSAAVQRSAGDAGKLSIELDGLEKQLKNSVNGVKDFARPTKSLGRFIGGVSEEINSLLSKATGLTVGFGKFAARIATINTVWKLWNTTIRTVRDSLQNVIEFDQGLKNIQAITSATTETIRRVAVEVRALAVRTTFAPAELTQAFTLLGQAGFTATEGLNALSAVANLSIGTMTGTEQSVKVLTTTIRAFKLDASDAAKVADVLVGAVNRSKLTIEGLNTALNFAGPAAAEAGLTIEQTAAALGTMANQGLRFSTQGTGLRQVLAALIAPSARFRNVLERLGVNANQVNPLLNDFGDVLDTLAKAGFGGAEAFEGLEKRTAGAAIALVRGREQFRQMSSEVGTTNEALLAATTQMDGFRARIDRLRQRTLEAFNTPAVKEYFDAFIDGAEKAVVGIERLVAQIDAASRNERFRDFLGLTINTENTQGDVPRPPAGFPFISFEIPRKAAEAAIATLTSVSESLASIVLGGQKAGESVNRLSRAFQVLSAALIFIVGRTIFGRFSLVLSNIGSRLRTASVASGAWAVSLRKAVSSVAKLLVRFGITVPAIFGAITGVVQGALGEQEGAFESVTSKINEYYQALDQQKRGTRGFAPVSLDQVFAGEAEGQRGTNRLTVQKATEVAQEIRKALRTTGKQTNQELQTLTNYRSQYTALTTSLKSYEEAVRDLNEAEDASASTKRGLEEGVNTSREALVSLIQEANTRMPFVRELVVDEKSLYEQYSESADILIEKITDPARALSINKYVSFVEKLRAKALPLIRGNPETSEVRIVFESLLKEIDERLLLLRAGVSAAEPDFTKATSNATLYRQELERTYGSAPAEERVKVFKEQEERIRKEARITSLAIIENRQKQADIAAKITRLEVQQAERRDRLAVADRRRSQVRGLLVGRGVAGSVNEPFGEIDRIVDNQTRGLLKNEKRIARFRRQLFKLDDDQQRAAQALEESNAKATEAVRLRGRAVAELEAQEAREFESSQTRSRQIKKEIDANNRLLQSVKERITLAARQNEIQKRQNPSKALELDRSRQEAALRFEELRLTTLKQNSSKQNELVRIYEKQLEIGGEQGEEAKRNIDAARIQKQVAADKVLNQEESIRLLGVELGLLGEVNESWSRLSATIESSVAEGLAEAVFSGKELSKVSSDIETSLRDAFKNVFISALKDKLSFDNVFQGNILDLGNWLNSQGGMGGAFNKLFANAEQLLAQLTETTGALEFGDLFDTSGILDGSIFSIFEEGARGVLQAGTRPFFDISGILDGSIFEEGASGVLQAGTRTFDDLSARGMTVLEKFVTVAKKLVRQIFGEVIPEEDKPKPRRVREFIESQTAIKALDKEIAANNRLIQTIREKIALTERQLDIDLRRNPTQAYEIEVRRFELQKELALEELRIEEENLKKQREKVALYEEQQNLGNEIEKESAERNLEAAKIEVEALESKVANQKESLGLLQQELELVGEVNQAWAQMADQIENEIADGISDIVFEGGSLKDLARGIGDTLKDSFKNVFRSAIKDKLSFDNVFQGNILDLGTWLNSEGGLSGAFDTVFGNAAGTMGQLGDIFGNVAGSIFGGLKKGGDAVKADIGTIIKDSENITGVLGMDTPGGLQIDLSRIPTGNLTGQQRPAGGMMNSISKFLGGGGSGQGYGWTKGLSNILGAAGAGFAGFGMGAGFADLVGGSGAGSLGASIGGAIGGIAGNLGGTLAVMNSAFGGVVSGVMGPAISAVTSTLGSVFPAMATMVSGLIGNLANAIVPGIGILIGFALGELVNLFMPQVDIVEESFMSFQKQLQPVFAQAGLNFMLPRTTTGDLKGERGTIEFSRNQRGILQQSGIVDDSETAEKIRQGFIAVGFALSDTVEEIDNFRGAALFANQAMEGLAINGQAISDQQLATVFQGLSESIGGLEDVAESVNEDIAELEEKGKLTAEKMEVLEDVASGLGTLLAVQFPKGIDGASKALRQFRADGTVDLEAVRGEIQQVVDAAQQLGDTAFEEPIKIILETGDLNEAKKVIGKSLDEAITGAIVSGFQSAISTIVLQQGVFTPLADLISELTVQLGQGAIGIKQFGEEIRRTLVSDVIPATNLLVGIFDEFLNALGTTIGVPLQRIPDFFDPESGEMSVGLKFTSDQQGVQLGFRSSFAAFAGQVEESLRTNEAGALLEEERREEFIKGQRDATQARVEAAPFEEELVSIIYGNSSRLGPLLQEFARHIVNTAPGLGGDRLAAVQASAAGEQNAAIEPDENKIRKVAKRLVRGDSLPPTEIGIFNTKGKEDKATIVLSGSLASGLSVNLADHQQKTPRVATVDFAAVEFDFDTATALEIGKRITEGEEAARQAFKDLAQQSGITRKDFIDKAVELGFIDPSLLEAGKEGELERKLEQILGNPEKVAQILNGFGEAYATAQAKYEKLLEEQEGKIRSALANLVDAVTTPEEFAAAFSALRQAFDEGIITQEQFDRLLFGGEDFSFEEIAKAVIADFNANISNLLMTLDPTQLKILGSDETLYDQVFKAFELGDIKKLRQKFEDVFEGEFTFDQIVSDFGRLRTAIVEVTGMTFEEFDEKMRTLFSTNFGDFADFVSENFDGKELADLTFDEFRQAMEDYFTENGLDLADLMNAEGLIPALQETLPAAVDVAKLFAESMEDGVLNVEIFFAKLEAAAKGVEALSGAISQAITDTLSGKDMKEVLRDFEANLKRVVGDALIEAFTAALVNELFISTLLGPFFEFMGENLQKVISGEMTREEFENLIKEQFPDVAAGISTAADALDPVLQMLLQLFTELGIIEGYDSALDKQEKLIEEQRKVAELWKGILDSARAAKNDLLFGEDAPQNFRRALSEGNQELEEQLRIFRSGASSEEERQKAAQEIIRLSTELFGTAESFGEAGAAGFQRGGRELELLRARLVAILSEVENTSVQRISELDVLTRQLEVLKAIEENTDPEEETTEEEEDTSDEDGEEQTPPTPELTGIARTNEILEGIESILVAWNATGGIGGFNPEETTSSGGSSLRSGGDIGNIVIGDININGSSLSNPQEVGREVVRTLVREVRSGAVGQEIRKVRGSKR